MSKLQLNIYKEETNENNETVLVVEKTYKTDTDNILMSSLEDFLIAYEEEEKAREEQIEDENKQFLDVVKTQRDQVKETAKRIFPNITDEELSRTKPSEIKEMAFTVMTFVLAEMGIDTEKN